MIPWNSQSRNAIRNGTFTDTLRRFQGISAQDMLRDPFFTMSANTLNCPIPRFGPLLVNQLPLYNLKEHQKQEKDHGWPMEVTKSASAWVHKMGKLWEVGMNNTSRKSHHAGGDIWGTNSRDGRAFQLLFLAAISSCASLCGATNSIRIPEWEEELEAPCAGSTSGGQEGSVRRNDTTIQGARAMAARLVGGFELTVLFNISTFKWRIMSLPIMPLQAVPENPASPGAWLRTVSTAWHSTPHSFFVRTRS